MKEASTQYEKRDNRFRGTLCLPERIGYVAGAALSLIAPPVYCLLTGDYYLCLLLLWCDCLGLVFGYRGFKMSANSRMSCMPQIQKQTFQTNQCLAM